MDIFYAKSARTNGFVTNKEHLKKVADLAASYAQMIGREPEGRLAGNLHDFGKYSTPFQQVLKGIVHGIDHALPGAVILYMVCRLYKSSQTKRANYAPVLESIQGHHDGLVGLPDLTNILYTIYTNPDADCCPSNKVPSLRGPQEYMAAWQAFTADFPDWHIPAIPCRSFQNMVEDMLDTRMLFSCLVDADYTISALDNDTLYMQKSSGPTLNIDDALDRLNRYCATLRADSTADPALNSVRDMVFQQCGAAGESPCGLFTLTAPTGVGKTLAMLNFALHHCKVAKLQRIIVVLPFLSLADQSEKTYEKILPNLLVDHSQKDLSDEARELASRWDAPLVLTTSVKFFESLFASKPTDCRKLHNIANSVVLFDEAQTLPADLASTTIQAINTLCKKCHCSVLFSTATQPNFRALANAEWKPTEILPNCNVLYDQMRRVQVEWRLFINEARSQNPSYNEIAIEMASQNSVCAIVNLRRHAQELLNRLKLLCEKDSLFLITTDLCPAHRLTVIDKIKDRLKAGLPCHVVATQCIEAGVDLDFDVMYRALAPMESIIQAAGRCNRNNRLPKGGQVIVFEPADARYPGATYERAANIVKDLWAEGHKMDINDVSIISEYYCRFFSKAHARPALEEALSSKSYANVAKEYRLIKQCGVQLIVPYQNEKKLFDDIQAQARCSGLSTALLRKAAPITVSCFNYKWVEEHAEPLYFTDRYGKRCTESTTYILNAGQENCYNEITGLTFVDILPEDYMV